MTARPQSAPVLQTRLSAAPWLLPQGRRLPGTAMCDPDDWLRVDEAYAGQMALRDILLDRDPGAVWGETPGSRAAQRELLDIVLGWIAGRGGFALSGDTATRPDGARVRIDRDRPMQTLGRLVQQDLCLMQAGPGGEHRLTAAILCFPAYWSLADKLGRPLTGIHRPVPVYESGVARRVQRLFDFLRDGAVLERANCHPAAGWAIATPAREGDAHGRAGPDAPYARIERQTLRRLPETGAVVFAIHTLMLDRAALPETDRAGIAAHFGAGRPD